MFYYVFHILLGSVFGFIPLLPILALYHFFLAKKEKVKGLAPSLSHTIFIYIFCFSLLSIFTATAAPNIYSHAGTLRLNLIPFIDITTNYVQYVENILLFIPFGFLLPLLWKNFGKLRMTLIAGAGFSLFIEIVQIFTIRVTDIDDLLMNTAGTVIGYFIFIGIKKAFPKITNCSLDTTRRKWEPYIYFGFSYFVMFFFAPLVGSLFLGPARFQ